MRIFGHTSKAGATPLDIAADTVYAADHELGEDAKLVKLSAYVDGLGSGSGDQPVRGVVFDADGDLLVQGEDVTLEGDSQGEWVDLPFAEPVEAAAGTWRLGLHADGPTDAWRVYCDAAENRIRKADDFGDGTATPFGAGTTEAGRPVLFATYIVPWTAPSEDDQWLARLAFADAQRELGDVAADPRTGRLAYCTWHGTYLDAEREGSSFAIVQTGSPLEALVGDRVKVTTSTGACVVAFVHRDMDLDLTTPETLSLSRRLFAELGDLSLNNLLVRVEVVGQATA